MRSAWMEGYSGEPELCANAERELLTAVREWSAHARGDGGQGAVWQLHFSPLGQYLASARRAVVKVWAVAVLQSGERAAETPMRELRLTENDGDVTALVWLPHRAATLALGTSAGALFLFTPRENVAQRDNSAELRVLRSSAQARLVGDGSVWKLVVSDDGRVLIMSTSSGRVSIWHLRVKHEKEEASFEDHSSYVVALAVADDAHWFASGSLDCTVCVYERRPLPHRGHEIARERTLHMSAAVSALAFFSPPSAALATHCSTANCAGNEAEHARVVKKVLFVACKDATVTALCAATGARLYSLANGDISMIGHTRALQIVTRQSPDSIAAFDPPRSAATSAALVLVSTENVVRVYSAENGLFRTALSRVRGILASVQVCSTHCARIVTGGSDKTLRVWDSRSGQCLASWRTQRGSTHDTKITAVAISPLARHIALAREDGSAALLYLKAPATFRSELCAKARHR